MDIDFSPITQAATYESDSRKLSRTGKSTAAKTWLVIAMIFIPPFQLVLIYKLVRFFLRQQKEGPLRRAAIEAFCARNGFTYTNLSGKWLQGEAFEKSKRPANFPFKAEYFLPNQEISGTILGLPFWYGMGAAFVKEAQYPKNVFSVDLKLVLPKLYANAKSNNLAGLDASPTNFLRAAPHVLEGDFPSFYEVIIEENSQIDMYRILTPEVMDVLKRNNHYDIWINEGQLVMLTFADAEARFFAGIPEVMENATTLLKEIDQIARSLPGQTAPEANAQAY